MQTIFKYPPDDSGRTLDMSDQTVQEERAKWGELYNEPSRYPLSDRQHFDFEVEMSVKYREEFIEYLNSIGGLEYGYLTIKAQNRESNLLEYYIKRRKQRQNGKAAISAQYVASRPNDFTRGC